KEKKPDLDKRLLMTPAVDLDLLLNYYLTFFAQGGKNVLTDPLYFTLTFNIMQRSHLITIYAALICLPLIFAFFHLIIRLACGGDYPETGLSLRLLLIGVFFVSANAFRVQFLLVCGKTRIYSRIHVFMAMIGLPLIFLLIYSFSYTGAAIAAIVIESGIFAITYFTVKKLSYS
ncbi:MAG: polysaccharide biosynthesis C-terminal domain-containing protein, partial [Candidatus Omnitrophota bacterium]